MEPRTLALYATKVAILAAIIVTVFSCNLLGEDPKTKPAIDDSDAVTGKGMAVLAQLGIPTELGPRLKVDGSPMSDTENPFGENVIKTQVKNEIFTISSDNKVKLLNVTNVSGGLTTDLPVGMNALLGTIGQIKRPVAADINGDGKQAIVTAVFNTTDKTITMFTINNGETYSMANRGSITWKTTRTYSDNRDYYDYPTSWPFRDTSLNATRNWNHMIDLAAGDIDGDGKDEVVIASEGTLYVLDHDLSLKMQKDFLPVAGSNSNNQILRVEIGDLNNDGKAELVVTNGTSDRNKTAEVYVYGYEPAGSLTSLLSGVRSVSAASTNLRTAEIAIGDVDGDKKQDIVLAGLKDNDRICVTMVLKVQEHSGIWTDSFVNVVQTSTLKSQAHNYWAGDWAAGREGDSMVPILAVGDLDGDGKDEIVANDDVLAVTVTSGNYSIGYAFSNGENILREGLVGAFLPGWGGIWGNFVNGSVAGANDRYPDTAYYNQVKIGDLDGDGKEEIVVLDYKRASIRTYSYGNNTIVKGTSDIVLTTEDTDRNHFSKYLCLADVNNDGKAYKYNGHALIFSDPVVIGVISGPPYWDIEDPKNPGELIQDTGNMATSFGLGAGASAGVGGSVEVAVSGKIGAAAVLPVAANGKAEATVEITGGFAASFDVSLSGSVELTYSCPAGVDKVMFFSVPIDVYEYENVNDSAEKFYIEPPRAAETQYVDVDWYNANNGDYPDISAAALKHIIGDPYSYPRFADATSIFNVLPGASILIQSIQEVAGNLTPTVPQGKGETSLEYSLEGAVGTSFSIFGEVRYEQECSFVGLVGASASVKLEGNVSTELSVSTSIGGSVGGLVTDFYKPGYKYDWGLYAYPYSTAGSIEGALVQTVLDPSKALSNNFLVLNYWVEPK